MNKQGTAITDGANAGLYECTGLAFLHASMCEYYWVACMQRPVCLYLLAVVVRDLCTQKTVPNHRWILQTDGQRPLS